MPLNPDPKGTMHKLALLILAALFGLAPATAHGDGGTKLSCSVTPQTAVVGDSQTVNVVGIQTWMEIGSVPTIPGNNVNIERPDGATFTVPVAADGTATLTTTATVTGSLDYRVLGTDRHGNYGVLTTCPTFITA